MQVDESVHTYGRTVPLRSTVVYGGIPMDPQIKALRGGVEILVATPGRLLDLVGQKVANLGQVEILVLDEADRMLDMGFLPDIQKIIALLPARRQNLMFSATFSDDIRRLSGGILRDPATVEVAPRNTTARGDPPARLPGRPRPQGSAPRPPHPQGRPAPGPRLHPDQARRQPARHAPRSRRPRRRGDPLRSLAARADARARGLQVRRDPGPRRDRRRGARPRHRGPAGRRQLRAAVEPAGLHPPDRPDRPGRARPARRSRSSASTRRTCCAASSGCSSTPSRGPSRRASSPIAMPSRGRSARVPVTPGRASEHHAHRKPVAPAGREPGARAAVEPVRGASAERLGDPPAVPIGSTTAPGKKNPSIRSARMRSTA